MSRVGGCSAVDAARVCERQALSHRPANEKVDGTE